MIISELLAQCITAAAESPAEMDRIRDLVMSLAIQGKLVKQDPSEEPATELLTTIAHHREAMLTQSGQRTPKKPAPLDIPDTPLPPGWQWTQIDKLGLVGPKNDVDSGSTVGFVPMSRITTAHRQPHSWEERRWEEIRKNYTHVADGDVAVAKITPCFENGKAAVFRDLPGGVGAATTELHVLRPTEGGVLPEYVLLFLRSPEFRRAGEPIMTGTAGQKRLPRDHFTGTAFPLPPRIEQERIVARADELLRICDQVEANAVARNLVRAKTRSVCLASLTDATTVTETRSAWRHIDKNWMQLFDEPAALNEARFTIRSLATSGALSAPLTQVNVEEDLPDLPDEWSWTPLGEILEDGLANGWSPKSVDYETPVKALKLSATTSGSFNDTQFKYLDVPVEACEKYWLHPGDLLVQRSNTPRYVGMAAVFTGPTEQFIFPDLMMRGRVRESHCVEYIQLALTSRRARRYLQSAASGTSQSMVKVSQGIVKAVVLAVPPLAEQQRLVSVVSRLEQRCDALERSLSKRLAIRQDLLKAAATSLATHAP